MVDFFVREIRAVVSGDITIIRCVHLLLLPFLSS